MSMQSLMSAAEAAGMAMAVPEDMLVAEERELEQFAQKNKVLLSGADASAAGPGRAASLRKLIAERGGAWMPEWLRGGAPA